MKMATAAERWLPVHGFEGRYEVSDLGRVRSLDRVQVKSDGRTCTIKGRIRSLSRSGRGDYLTVSLKVDGRTVTRFVHRLVAEAFLGPRPPGLECCHGNGDGHDNRLENLRWGSHGENVQDTVAHGRHNKASATHCPSGHPYDDENTYVWTNPKTGSRSRACHSCLRARDQRRALKRRNP